VGNLFSASGLRFQDSSGKLFPNQWVRVARLQWESCCYSGSGLEQTESSEIFRTAGRSGHEFSSVPVYLFFYASSQLISFSNCSSLALASSLCNLILHSLLPEEVLLVNWSYLILCFSRHQWSKTYVIRPLCVKLGFSRLKWHIPRSSFHIVNATCEWSLMVNGNYAMFYGYSHP